MITKKIYWSLAAISSALLFGSCSGESFEDPHIGKSEVKIEIVGNSDPEMCKVLFTPSEGVTEYSYAIGTDADKDAFLSGSLEENYGTVTGDEPSEVTFEDLEAGYYTIYAIATDSTGVRGGLCTMRAFLPDGYFRVEPYYLSDRSAGFKFNITQLYYRFEYYIGKEGDREKFLNGEVDKEVLTDISMYHVINFLDLEPATDYVLYAIAYDRKDVPTDLVEMPFSTYAEGESAAIEFNIKSIDIYKGVYELIPNEKCGRIDMIVSADGNHDNLIENDAHFKGDIPLMVNNWCSVGGDGTASAVGTSLVKDYITASLTTDYPLEIYAVAYDMDFNVAAVYNFKFSTPSFNSEAGIPEASIEVSDITSTGATYTITKGSNMFAAMFETLDADWFDDLKNSAGYSEYYIHDLLFANGQYFVYGNDMVDGKSSFEEATGTPLTRYYAVVCPMNENGPAEDKGWGAMVLEEYRTLSK